MSTHTFISYVREDAGVADYVGRILRANGIEPWIDRERLGTGQRWKDELRRAIENGSHFISIFSAARVARDRSMAEEELNLAIEELRRRPKNRAWFLAVKIDGGEIPDYNIGGGETLRDLQFEDAAINGWRKSLSNVLAAHGIERPTLDVGEPLAPGLGDVADIVGGRFTMRDFHPTKGLEQLNGIVFHIQRGSCERLPDGQIVASFESYAPNEQLQKINEMLGLMAVRGAKANGPLSSDPATPTRFQYSRAFAFPAGIEILLPGKPPTRLPSHMDALVEFVADTVLRDFDLRGSFSCRWDYRIGGRSIYVVTGTGDVELALRHAVRPTGLS